MPTSSASSTAPAIEPRALYRAAEVFTTKSRRGLLPIGKSALWKLVASGRIEPIKLGADGRATFFRGADLIALFQGEAR